MVGQPKSQGTGRFYTLPDLWNKKSFNRRFDARPKNIARLPQSCINKKLTTVKKQKDYSDLKKEIRERAKGGVKGNEEMTMFESKVLVGDISKLAESLRQEVKRAKREAGFFDDDSSSPETSLVGSICQ